MRVRHLGLKSYAPVYEAMKAFTNERQNDTEDELWVVEHEPVFTQGMAGKAEHLLQATDIPVVQIDRGGQITYHGPGQLVVYTLVDFKRLNLSVRELVTRLENSIIGTLKHYGIDAQSDAARPGVYVNAAKIASLGLRIRQKSVYHGLSLNIDMDLSPFSLINPCGYAGMAMTQMADFGPAPDFNEAATHLTQALQHALYAHTAE